MKIAALLVAFISITLGAVAQRPAKQQQMKQALLIVDIQNDYFPGGRHPLKGAPEAAQQAKKVLAHFRKHDLPVIHVQGLSTNEGATFFLPNTDGVKINEAVLPLPGEKVITKHYPNSFRETDLLAYLKANKIQQLTILGMMTHVCIDATVKAAKDNGFDCTVVADACATLDVEVLGEKVPADAVQHSLLAAMAFYYATISTTAQVIAD
ncbi:Nicotinamidase-related amidase [Chitinophaga jiangningensis]|uniref:Nicotinamidase-related amidase n=1 Tax=Chitinophaga jiangningensis TaxID=1419482 RepID=A0A1M7MAR4_9BACT|nr:cysteine hydrolase family protein [Chitinophaga jiangningensis]SHM87369.1 Nicotinamidase-related amidase [Chitinophaga jiangningensis]